MIDISYAEEEIGIGVDGKMGIKQVAKPQLWKWGVSVLVCWELDGSCSCISILHLTN